MQILDRSIRSAQTAGPITLINLFTPKAGHHDDFIAAQTAEYRRLQGRIIGWLGNHLHASVGDARIVNIATFESLQAYNDWREHPDFAAHVERIRPLVERAEPMLLGPAVYSAGGMGVIKATTAPVEA